MVNFNIANLKRDSDAIKRNMKVIGDAVTVTDTIQVMFPERFVNINLAILGSTVRVISYYAIIDSNGNYAISNIPIFIELTPSSIDDVVIDDVVYKLLTFDKNSTFTESTNLFIDNRFLYDIMKEFYINGKIPWYMNYDDVINIFAKTKKFANSNLGDNPITMEILSSIIARDSSDKKELYRYTIKNIKEVTNKRPAYIGLMNVFYTFDNTVSKLAGSYYGQGVNSALIDNETETSNIEDMLRA